MALQDDRYRIAARNDATRPPMVQAVFGGPTNKKSQLQKQIDAERAARPAVSSRTAAPTAAARPLAPGRAPMASAQPSRPLAPDRAPAASAGVMTSLSGMRPATNIAPADPRSAPQRAARDDQFLAQDFVAGNKADRSNALNINRPMAIPGTDMQYAGQYGDTAVIERPGAKGERSFSDTDGVAGQNRGVRPAVAGTPTEPQLSPAEQYIKNTTMSDGTRVFGSGVGAPTGGPNANERLQQARLAAIARGDGALVEKQLAEEGMTPAQRNAYRADPLKAYEIDQVTKAENAKAESIGMKNYRDDILKRAGLGLQAGKAAQGKTSAFSKRLVDTAKMSFPDGDLEVGNPGAMREILSAILAKKVGPDGAGFEQIAAQEATKLRAAAQAEGFDPGAYLAQYMESNVGDDYSATDEVMGF